MKEFAIGQRWALTTDVAPSGVHKAGMAFTISEIKSEVYGLFLECQKLTCGQGSHNLPVFFERGSAFRLCSWKEADTVVSPEASIIVPIYCSQRPAHAKAPFCEFHISMAMAMNDIARPDMRDWPRPPAQSHNISAGIGIWNLRAR